MPTQRRGWFALLLLLAATSLGGDEWEELRRRPGNDDLFVMIDASRSMASSPDGSLAEVKAFLQDVFARYVKDGDRLILMTYDAEAHVNAVMPFVERRRDVELFREVLDSVDVRRVIRYGGTWPDLTERRDGPWLGGGAAADSCEMWRLADRAIHKYSEPAHRQLFLLVTGGLPSAPAYRPCRDPGVPVAFAAAVRRRGIRAGVIAARPSHSVDFLQIPKGSWKSVGFDPDSRRMDRLRGDMLELFNARVDLVQPHALNLGAQYAVDPQVPLTVVNRSSAERKIAIRSVHLHLRDGRGPLQIPVTPSTITLPPRQATTLALSLPHLFEKPGEYRGQLVFEFAPGARFDPSVLLFSVTKQTWLEAFGGYAAWTAVTLVVVLTGLILWLAFEKTLVFAPATIKGQCRGDPLARPCRAVNIGVAAPFGGGGAVAGELFVNAQAPSGLLFRAGADDWRLSWDGETFEPYSPGMPAVSSGSSEDEAWQFFVELNRRRTLAGIPAWVRSKLRSSARP